MHIVIYLYGRLIETNNILITLECLHKIDVLIKENFCIGCVYCVLLVTWPLDVSIVFYHYWWLFIDLVVKVLIILLQCCYKLRK